MYGVLRFLFIRARFCALFGVAVALMHCVPLHMLASENESEDPLLFLPGIGFFPDQTESGSCSPVQLGDGIQGCTLNLSGIVSTSAGPLPGDRSGGFVDATGNAARFNALNSIATDGERLYITDAYSRVRSIDLSSGATKTIAGGFPAVAWGDADGIAESARFARLEGISYTGGHIYVADGNNNKVRRIDPVTGNTTTFAGPPPGDTSAGDADGPRFAARFDFPTGITTDGESLFVAEAGGSRIRKISIATGDTTTLAGPPPGSPAFSIGDVDGPAHLARFNYPSGITTDGRELFVADFGNNKIRAIDIATGYTRTLAGPVKGNGFTSDTDGAAAVARFADPAGITTDGTYLYVSEFGNNKIRRVTIANGETSTLAGPMPGDYVSGDRDGPPGTGRFASPMGVVSDGQSLYVADTGNHKIRRID